jgi:Peptidase U49
MTDSLPPKEVIKALMKGAAPERAEEIEALWTAYNPSVVIVDDRKGISLNATKDRIEFDLKTMDAFWLIGFSGWRAIECYSPHVVVSLKYRKPLAEIFDADNELPEIERSYKERLSAAKRLIAEQNTSAAPWPDDLPRPSSDRTTQVASEYQAAFDLTALATAFTFFHEFRHVILDFDKERPKDRKEEELQADVWAREFMTVKLAQYAKTHNHNYHEVLRKRSMGLALAALILHEITPLHGGNCDYFSIKTRLATLLGNTPLPDDDHFWIFATSLIVGVFRQRHLAFELSSTSPRALAIQLLGQLPD